MNTKLVGVVVAVPFLAACAGSPADIPRDRFALGTQPQVYIIHNTAKKTFVVEGTGYSWLAGGPITTLLQMNESARLQHKFDLQDPVLYGKDRLAETLRVELGLTNVRILQEPSNLPILPEDAADEGPRNTFKQKYPTGTVIEIVTQHWGMDRGVDYYRIRYYATAKLTSLTESKVLLSTHCPWVVLDMTDKNKLPPPTGYDAYGKYDPNAASTYMEAVEKMVYADNGALLKTTFRKAAEVCADRVITRFLGHTRNAKP